MGKRTKHDKIELILTSSGHLEIARATPEGTGKNDLSMRNGFGAHLCNLMRDRERNLQEGCFLRALRPD